MSIGRAAFVPVGLVYHRTPHAACGFVDGRNPSITAPSTSNSTAGAPVAVLDVDSLLLCRHQMASRVGEDVALAPQDGRKVMGTNLKKFCTIVKYLTRYCASLFQPVQRSLVLFRLPLMWGESNAPKHIDR
jgi:hypothetical protein